MYQCQRAIAESSRIELIYPVVVEQSVCSFANIAGDGPEVRDHEIQQITIKLLTHLIKPQTSVNWLIFFINVSTWYSFFLDVIVRLHSCVTLLRPFQKLEPYWIGSESDIWQPWNHHYQPVVVSFPWRCDGHVGDRSSSWFENAAFCCMFVVIWQPTLTSELSSDSGLQNKLSVVWFFNFQVLSASGKFFTSSLAFNRYCYHPATTGNSFFL